MRARANFLHAFVRKNDGLAIRGARPILALCIAAVLGGCTQTDPYVRPGDWHPTGANAANLGAMAADPADLLRGRGATSDPGDIAAAAIARLRADAVKRLPASSIAEVHTTDSGAPAAPGSEATPAAPVAAPAGGSGPAS